MALLESQVSLTDKIAADVVPLQRGNEQTPSKGETNKKAQMRSTNDEFNDRNQSLRRSVRTVVKPKRYVETSPIETKKPKVTKNKSPQKSKSVIKRKTESTSERRRTSTQQQANQTIQTQQETQTQSPKKCRKMLFHRKRRKVFPLIKLQEFLLDLDRSRSPSPPTVPILTLNDMTVDEIMTTFEPNKLKLDALFEKIKPESFIYCYEGISHYLVIELITNEMQNLMMDKLSEHYETESNPKYGSHVINVLMPEWILNIFMERYNMERNAAIRHIKEQNSYIINSFSNNFK